MEEKKKTKRVKIEVSGGVCYVQAIPDKNIVVEVGDLCGGDHGVCWVHGEQVCRLRLKCKIISILYTYNLS